MAALVGFVAKGIQSWITSGGKLRDIAGGSDLVEEIPGRVRDDMMKACRATSAGSGEGVTILSTGAGAFRLLVADDGAAARMVRLLPLMIAEWAPGLRYGLAWHELAGDRPTAREFDAFENELRTDGGLAGPVLPPATPFTLRAQRTGEPAVDDKERDDDGVQGPEAVDCSMRRRRDAAGGGRASVFKTRLFPDMAGDFAKDVDVIVGDGRYMAVLHADGNGLGQLFMAIGKDESLGAEDRTRLLRDLSNAVKEATEEAFLAALHDIVRDVATRKTIPVRPIVLGGDDVTALLPARDAIRFTETFLTRFGIETGERLKGLKNSPVYIPDRLTACAGIAFVKAHYPFDQAHTLAESLCRFAKAGSRRGEGRTLASLAFHRVTTTLARDFAGDIVAHDLSQRVDDELRLLTMAPYRVPEGDGEVPDGNNDEGHTPLARLRDLLRLADVVDRLPRGSWRELAGLVRENDVLAAARYHRLVEVIPKEAAHDLRSALSALGCAPPRLWTSKGTKERPARSPMLDVTALLAATGRGKGAGEEAEEAVP
ncbi:hypothetical protein HL658_13445 [Azospirillum sp. RWY-5-1]|uniref:Cas10/Cmr2 second palm domain-containing protein n=1 Tax=Azospirillum oleiclasticum TaxID=2735135 RepID=A0ABX2T8R1_9PROT|nr:hypothetical protein [Azospirillum oleiclasticum]NYZ13557.1 hypothetical protein [Azospirillum oleiclasticum]NYZ20717.1 hypothetical protein [Azospirillum oleiclasticum]